MWRLVKADFQYNWLIFIIPWILGAILLVYVGFILGWPNLDEDLAGTRTLLMAMAAFVFFVRGLRVLEEKRDRCHGMLPLPVVAVAISRLMSVVCLWSGFVLLYWISTSIIRPYRGEIIIFEMLTATGFILTANALPYIHRDVSVCLQKNYQRTLWMVVYTASMCAGTILFFSLSVTQNSWRIVRVFLPLKEYIAPYSTSFSGGCVCLISGLCVTGLSVFLFKQRKTFVE